MQKALALEIEPMFAIALSGYFEGLLKVNLCAADIVSSRTGYSVMSASKLHRYGIASAIYLPVVKQVYRGERDSHRVCAHPIYHQSK